MKLLCSVCGNFLFGYDEEKCYCGKVYKTESDFQKRVNTYGLHNPWIQWEAKYCGYGIVA